MFCISDKIKRAFALLLVSAMLLAPASCGARNGAEPDGAAGSNVLSENKAAEQSLTDFLKRFVRWYPVSRDGKWKYDCSDTASDGNILACIATPASCADWTLYSDIPEEDCFVEKSDDPKGWAKETYAYYAYDADTVEYIAREIFNVSSSDMDELAVRGEREHSFYKENGMYYSLFEGTLDSFIDINLISVDLKGERYIADFYVNSVGKTGGEDDLTLITGRCSAELELKTLGGKEFWSLYKFRSVNS